MNKTNVLAVIMIIFHTSADLSAGSDSNWSADLGIRGFKYSVNNQPQELLYNPVFTRWENINQNPDYYTVDEYSRLEPLMFNMNFGIDLFLRYKNHLMIKLGYDYSNPIGLGGKGKITYTYHPLTAESILHQYKEEKEFSYTSHQINYFIGPVVNTEDGSEMYMGFSMMSPTWVKYREKYSKNINGAMDQDYDKTFKGFFGNCRALFGIQIPVSEKLKLGSEAVFSFFNGIEVESGDLKDEGFRFPLMKWDITLRYNLF